MQDIITIPNFLSAQDAALLIQMGKSQHSLQRTGIQNDLVPAWKNVANFDISPGSALSFSIADIHERVGDEIKRHFLVEKTKPREDGYFYEYGMGDFYRSHCDAQSITTLNGITVGSRKPTSSDVSTILYLNDNFVGGEIDFGFKSQRIKPQTGMLVMFYGGWQNSHCVRPIELGTRYCIVNWFITWPNLVPMSEVIPEPYSHVFAHWQEEYQKVK